MLEESRPFFRDRSVAKFPLPLRERERVRGDKKNQAPSPLSSPVRECVAMRLEFGLSSRTDVRDLRFLLCGRNEPMIDVFE